MRFRNALLAVAAAIGVSATCAQAPLKPQALEGAVADRLSAMFRSKTNMVPQSIGKSPLPGFVEVISGSQVFYMDLQGKWLFDGHLVDLDTRTSVTAVRRQALESADKPALDWKALDFNDAIKLTRGTPSPGRVLVTFEDPNCGFCKKLAQEVDKLDNLTVYTFPISILGDASKAKNEALWCSKDRAKAWKAVMAGQDVTSGSSCDLAALSRNGELAGRLKVSGTPTMFLADGSRLPGFMDAAAIERKLAVVAGGK